MECLKGEGCEGARVIAERRFLIADMPQRSPEWFAARCGRLTSSDVAKIFMEGRKKGDESATKRDLRIRLACERLTGVSQDDGGEYRNAYMQRGVEREGDARLAYEAYSGRVVQEVGLLTLPDLHVGCSLDGYVGDYEGIVELKCPKTATHLEYLRTVGAPDDYLPQIRHQLWISGAAWCDFVSFDDRLPDKLQLVVRRMRREDADLPAHELAVRGFLSEIEREIASIQALMEAA
jgi:hypothetical protein